MGEAATVRHKQTDAALIRHTAASFCSAFASSPSPPPPSNRLTHTFTHTFTRSRTGRIIWSCVLSSSNEALWRFDWHSACYLSVCLGPGGRGARRRSKAGIGRLGINKRETGNEKMEEKRVVGLIGSKWKRVERRGRQFGRRKSWRRKWGWWRLRGDCVGESV